MHISVELRINIEPFFFKYDLILCFLCVLFITIFRVSVPLPCTHINSYIFECAGVASLRKLVPILKYRFALRQQQKYKKMCHLMFSVEKFARVTCMLDNNLLIDRILYIV